MIYRVTVRTEGKEYLLHDPRDDEIQLINPEYVENMGKNGEFTFRISPLHPNKDKIVPMASEIMLWRDKEMFFCCRLLDREEDFYRTGQATCEGELAFLLDSIQRPYEFTGSIADFFAHLLDIHNSQVEERKRFELGNITVAGAQITRSSPDYTSTMNEMLTKLQDINGGYLHVRYADGKKFLDYVNDYGGVNNQVIRFGENLLDLTRHVDPMNMITILVPIGATIESEDYEEEPQTVNISSVNDGKDYIVHEEAVAKYGRIWGSQNFDDVTDPEILLAKGRAYLEEAVSIPETIELKALDLSLMGVDTEPLQVGYWTYIISKPHGLQQKILLSKKITNLVDPAKNSIVLGKVRNTFTGQVAKDKVQITERINSVAASTSKEINRKVENATQLITGGKGGYVVLDIEDPDTGKKSHPWRILIMDTPDKETAHSVIQINKNGIGFSRTGINGPYDNAWTIDGNLVADFITTGTMLCDRVRGGTLEVGGVGLGKDGSIKIISSAGTVLGTFDKKGITINDGKINAPEIIGGSAEFGGGLFAANKDYVYISGFMGQNAWGRDIFQSFDEQCGMSANPSKRGGLWFWAGWRNDGQYDFLVNNLGEVHCNDIYLNNDQSFWKGWGISKTMQDVYNRISNLQKQIDDIDIGGNN